MPGVYPLLLVIGFSSSLTVRSLDPLTVAVAGDLTVAPETAALLGTALAIPYAMSQPILGPVGDHFGKGRLITIALCLITVSVFASALAPSFLALVLARALTGIAAGGIVPIGQAMIGDMYRGQERQIAIARSTMVVFLGQLTGASLGGLAEAWIGWRGVMLACGCIASLATLAAILRMPKARPLNLPRFSLRTVAANYMIIFRKPRAWACYGNVTIQTGIMFGLLPFIALILERQGLGGASEAGLIIAGFCAGSLILTLTIPFTLRLMSRPALLITGAVCAFAGLLAISLGLAWYWQMAIFAGTGFGYFLQHNAIQGEVADLTEDLRASAYAMHAFSFFLGSAIAPIIYSVAFARYGVAPTLTGAALTFLSVGVVSSVLFSWFHRRGL